MQSIRRLVVVTSITIALPLLPQPSTMDMYCVFCVRAALSREVFAESMVHPCLLTAPVRRNRAPAASEARKSARWARGAHRASSPWLGATRIPCATVRLSRRAAEGSFESGHHGLRAALTSRRRLPRLAEGDHGKVAIAQHIGNDALAPPLPPIRTMQPRNTVHEVGLTTSRLGVCLVFGGVEKWTQERRQKIEDAPGALLAGLCKLSKAREKG